MNIFPTKHELMILAAMRDGTPRHAFEIMREAKIKRGTVYVLLQRLEERGFIRVTRRSQDHPGMPRPHYALSALGKQILDAYRKILA